MSETLPKGWKYVPLSKLAKIVSGGTPSRDVNSYWGGQIPWVTPSDITKSDERYLTETQEKITQLGLQSSSASLLPPGTILMTSRATVGESCIAGTEVCTNQGFKCLIPHKEVNSLFLYYQMQRMREAYKVFGIGSTFLEVNKKDTERFRVLIPEIETEQKAIATVIDSIDNTIEKTKSLIAKYQQIKAGLMHDLFTRGVTADGKLRPPREQAPELYKETPIGWIPKDWEVRSLDEHVRIIDCKHYTPVFRVEGYPFVRPRNVKVDGLEWDGVDYVSAEDFRQLTDVYEPRRGDIVFSRNASFGVPCYVDTDLQFAIGQDVVIMTKKDSETHFVFYALTTSIITEQISQVSSGSTFGRINLGEIRKLLIPKPSEKEQVWITDRLASCDALLQRMKSDVGKLRQKKQGLMHDLLTGRVQVKAINPENI